MQPADIVKLFGIKRLIVLGVLLGIVALLGTGYYFGLDPMLQDKQSQLSAVKGQISSLRGKITNIKKEIEYLKENTPIYNELLEKGIFNDQDLFEVNRLIEYLKQNSGGLGFAYNVGEVGDLEDANAAKVKYALVKRTIKISKVTSELDIDIYSFFQNIKDLFPLFIKIKQFSVKRSKDGLTEDILDKITNEEKVGLVDAGIEFDWITLSSKHYKEEDPRSRGRRR